MSLPPEDEDRTVYQPKGSPTPAPTAEPNPASGGGKRRKNNAPAAPAPAAPVEASPTGQQIANGEVLNGIYRITRFLARGGMGEVYEAVNVHQTSEKVAVKVMLQHLAQDELVAAMFAKEAATLTRLHHEAIVQYRLAARDGQGRPYIVTEFIDGPSLEERLGKLELSDAEFVAVAQKLAAGLGTAHSLGAIHRDIAPDNILLAGADPARPKIIDFGIAKDAREQSGTIVGDGFAGKLRYVAPEQLGEYGRNVGAWSDIYSLALTLRAVLAGKHSDMGGSLSDAVRKRMTVPDLSDIPPPFRPAFEAALQPDPARRPQSMAAFNLMLTSGGGPNGAGQGLTGAGTGALGESTKLIPPSSSEGVGLAEKLHAVLPSGLAQNRLPLIVGGGALALVAMVGIVIAVSLSGEDAPPPPPVMADVDSGAEPAMTPGTPEFAALAQQAVGSIPCSWLTLAEATGGAVKFTGAAAVPAEAQTALAQTLEGAGANVPAIDFGNVVRFSQSDCGIIDALREVRGKGVTISTPQLVYEARMEPMFEGAEEKLNAKVPINIEGVNPGDDIALMVVVDGLPAQMLVAHRSELDTLVQYFKGNVTSSGYSMFYPSDLSGGLKRTDFGFVVITSPTPLPESIRTIDSGWPERFREGARSKGWTADVMWATAEDRQPG